MDVCKAILVKREKSIALSKHHKLSGEKELDRARLVPRGKA